MQTVSITEAKAQWLSLIERAAAGETFIVTKRGKPLAKLVAAGDEVADTSPAVERSVSD
jgi:prevent-host-death family protein